MNKLMLQTMGLYLNTVSILSPKRGAELGFRLFSGTVKTKIKTHQMDFLNTAKQIPFTFDGLKIQVYRWGTGPKNILFLHGWQSHSFRWKKYIESLSPGEYTVYALDAPGHGLSEGKSITVPHYGELIHRFAGEFGEFDTVVAHSLGGMSLLYALSHYPIVSVEKVAVLGVPGRAMDFMSHYQQMLRLSNHTVNNIIRQFESRIKLPIHYFETEKFVQNITVPGLIIHDLNDLRAPYMYAERMHKAWKTSELITTKGLGHNLRSGEVVEKVKSFIQKTRKLPQLN